jgi:hypothetical protein
LHTIREIGGTLFLMDRRKRASLTIRSIAANLDGFTRRQCRVSPDWRVALPVKTVNIAKTKPHRSTHGNPDSLFLTRPVAR